MSGTKYIEIDSTYRNRTQYPEPADFVVFLSQSGIRNKENSCDPVSFAAPQIVWSPDDYKSYTGSILQNGTNTLSQFIVCFPTNTMKKISDYYIGSPITVDTIDCIIAHWNFLSTDGINDCFNVTIKNNLSGITTSQIKTGGQTVLFSVISTDLNNGIFFIPNGVSLDNYYTDCIIYNQTNGSFRSIISYNGMTKLAGVDIVNYGGPLTGWNLSDTYVLRKTAPYEIGNLQIISSRSFQLPTTSSISEECYTGSFLRITSGLDDGLIYMITSYNKDPLNPRIGTIHGCFKSNPTDFCSYEILQFTKDNEAQLMYSGSTVSQQELVCYEIDLVDLVLPNKTLTEGGRIVSYPYVYVELQNISSTGAGMTNILYSNNPNSTRKMFRCPIDDMPNHLVPFIKIDSDGTRQTIKFKPNDNLKFAVYLPNGKLFKTIYEDNYSPQLPNPHLQITALFSIKRL